MVNKINWAFLASHSQHFAFRCVEFNALDEVDIVLNETNTHSESSKAKSAKAKRKKKRKRNGQTRKYTS